MTRVTLGEFKKAARDRSLRRSSSGGGVPTPMPVASSAVRRLHREGPEIAVAELNRKFDRSPYWGRGPAQARGWADVVRACFQTYVELASEDARPTIDVPVNVDVPTGDNTVGVSLDVVLLDPEGYVGRYLLWDAVQLTQDSAELLAAVVVRALQLELGDDRVAGAEIWHLRSAEQIFVDAPTALGRLHDIQVIVDGYVSS